MMGWDEKAVTEARSGSGWSIFARVSSRRLFFRWEFASNESRMLLTLCPRVTILPLVVGGQRLRIWSWVERRYSLECDWFLLRTIISDKSDDDVAHSQQGISCIIYRFCDNWMQQNVEITWENLPPHTLIWPLSTSENLHPSQEKTYSELGISFIIFAFCGMPVAQNREITCEFPSSAYVPLIYRPETLNAEPGLSRVTFYILIYGSHTK